MDCKRIVSRTLKLRKLGVSAGLIVGAVGWCQVLPAVGRSEFQLEGKSYKIVDRIVLENVSTLREPQKHPVLPPCTVVRKTSGASAPCNIPAGTPGDGGVMCLDAKASLPEPAAQTFSRIPGKDGPSLFASLVSVHTRRDSDSGAAEIILFNPCDPWIAVPIAQANQFSGATVRTLNRLSIRLKIDARDTRLSAVDLVGMDTRPETYRLLRLDEAILLVVPLKACRRLVSKKRAGDSHPEVQNIGIEGWYDSVTYSPGSDTYRPNIRPYRVSSAPHPAPVVGD